MNRLNDFASQFKAKFLLARSLKFDPFALKNTIVAWPKKSNSFVFYKNKFPHQFLYGANGHQHHGRHGGKIHMIEHAIIEIATEK